MTVEEIKEALFKECAEAKKELDEVIEKREYDYLDEYENDYNEKRTKFRTLFRLVADTLNLEYEYYNYKDKNGYEKYDQSQKNQILKHLKNDNLEEKEEL